jgi:hypothetical protein
MKPFRRGRLSLLMDMVLDWAASLVTFDASSFTFDSTLVSWDSGVA